MKRLLVSLVILTAVLSFFGYGVSRVGNAYAQITTQLDHAVSLSKEENLKEAEKCCEKALEIYKGCDLIFHGFINRKTAEEIGSMLSGLPSLAKKESLPVFLSKCEQTQENLEHLRQGLALSLKNLF